MERNAGPSIIFGKRIGLFTADTHINNSMLLIYGVWALLCTFSYVALYGSMWLYKVSPVCNVPTHFQKHAIYEPEALSHFRSSPFTKTEERKPDTQSEERKKHTHEAYNARIRMHSFFVARRQKELAWSTSVAII